MSQRINFSPANIRFVVFLRNTVWFHIYLSVPELEFQQFVWDSHVSCSQTCKHMLELEEWSHSSFNNQCFAAGGDGGVGEVSTLYQGQTCKTWSRNIPVSYQIPSAGLHSLLQETEKNNWISYCQILVDSAYVREIKVLRGLYPPGWRHPQGTHSSASEFCLPLCSGATAAVQVVTEKKRKGLRCH